MVSHAIIMILTVILGGHRIFLRGNDHGWKIISSCGIEKKYLGSHVHAFGNYLYFSKGGGRRRRE
jgi:hypothetical protein